MKDKKEFIKYLRSFVLPGIVKMYRISKGKPGYEEYWYDLKEDCKENIKMLIRRGPDMPSSTPPKGWGYEK